ncbi:glutamine-synthetase adenylyltransferase [Bifidobacterium sp. UTCIF-3]|uniref:bifunctional [glutamine synthetase] adenylyltransferase/[glutamine synthetase]-adenylyl-L-tyrosine phosphorylase n=1 Tax=unclassified Bifidobacterium TaxID=2608897 RepID=UPI00112A0DD0|nr:MULTISPECIES: bifunctional [glutamine synthetase] adenylyltransferase/[glutamine synthetase]-adenylyl-L-tyrosine phosphorylase [unclassified Bifidobacterium]TPF78738.1 glutamine-synthetase adenylyltransferase [Bifidobacterium sp. UTCIF-1]TPF82280.1 glutamine-synthetase adenylyltransferase [Bifidobacterium sp. UTCIF-3]TPF84558.1 glutamine-synthetase adenylyltransferase [Bifidobacterium sp. UTCIF-36]TPF93914.1 glutamine-synthetase adenylyltransferase [Bifidobacterium sp. UTBIF-68]
MDAVTTFTLSSMALIRAGIQDLDKARDLFHQLKVDGIDDAQCSELLGYLSHACDPDVALGNFVDIVNAMQSGGRDLRQVIPDGAALKRLVTVLGVSDAMGKFMRFRPDLVAAAAVDDCNSHLFNHAQRRARLLQAVGADPEERTSPKAGKALAEAATALRAAYRRQLAAIIAQDAEADDPTAIQPIISHELSDLADAALEGALAIARREVEGSDQVRFTIIGMGKLGAQELNYVSDVDLIYVVEPASKDVDHQTLIRVGTKMGTMLQRVCQSTIMGVAEQPLWQIDGGLRPEGKDGQLVRVLESHKNYYEQWAENWEFQALLKARPVAGDPELGQAYMAMTRPFVWSASKRKNFVYDCQKMRKRVEDLIPAPLKDREIKLGRGGLRDVEFTVQMLQLVHGRTDETLRTSNTLDSLQRLSEGGYISRKQAARMSQDYRFERVMEHRQQIWSLKRTHLFPDLGRASVGGLEKKRDIDVDELNRNQELRRLARAFGLHPEQLVDKYDDTRREVRHLHLDIYYRPMLPVNAQLEDDQITLSVAAAQERFASIGFGDPDAAIRHVQALTAGVGRAAKINRIILPAVLQWLGDGQNPDMGLLNWRKLEENFGTESGYLGFLRDSTSAAQRLCHVLSNSRFLGDALNKSVESISWLGDDGNLQARTREALDVQTSSALERFSASMNEFANSVRAMRRHEIERIGLAWMSGVMDDGTSLKAMTDVYDAIIDASLNWSIRHQTEMFGLDHAPADITVIAMGRYGGREVNFSSDADAILIYRPTDGAEDTQANTFAKKVVEDLRNILQGPTTFEPKIELDLDLRPEGKNGPIIRSYASCEEYYGSWASTWEHQALLRARYAAGDAELARDFLINIADPLRYPTQELSDAELQSIRKLKARMEAERLPRGVRRERHLKLGKGGLSDVEWTVQLLQLQHAGTIKDLRVNGTLEALDVLEAKKLVSPMDAMQLRKAWTTCTAARNGNYLWSGRANQADILPDDIYSLGGIAVYLGYGAHRGQHFENDLLAVMRKCRDVCQRLFYGQAEDDYSSGPGLTVGGRSGASGGAAGSAGAQKPAKPRMHVIAPRLEANRRRAQR